MPTSESPKFTCCIPRRISVITMFMLWFFIHLFIFVKFVPGGLTSRSFYDISVNFSKPRENAASIFILIYSLCALILMIFGVVVSVREKIPGLRLMVVAFCFVDLSLSLMSCSLLSWQLLKQSDVANAMLGWKLHTSFTILHGMTGKLGSTQLLTLVSVWILLIFRVFCSFVFWHYSQFLKVLHAMYPIPKIHQVAPADITPRNSARIHSTTTSNSSAPKLHTQPHPSAHAHSRFHYPHYGRSSPAQPQHVFYPTRATLYDVDLNQ